MAMDYRKMIIREYTNFTAMLLLQDEDGNVTPITGNRNRMPVDIARDIVKLWNESRGYTD